MLSSFSGSSLGFMNSKNGAALGMSRATAAISLVLAGLPFKHFASLNIRYTNHISILAYYDTYL